MRKMYKVYLTPLNPVLESSVPVPLGQVCGNWVLVWHCWLGITSPELRAVGRMVPFASWTWCQYLWKDITWSPINDNNCINYIKIIIGAWENDSEGKNACCTNMKTWNPHKNRYGSIDLICQCWVQDKQLPGALWPASLTKMAHFSLSLVMCRAVEEDFQCWPLDSTAGSSGHSPHCLARKSI